MDGNRYRALNSSKPCGLAPRVCHAINSSEIYGNNALTRFMSKRAQKKNGVRVNYGGEGTDPNLLIYW